MSNPIEFQNRKMLDGSFEIVGIFTLSVKEAAPMWATAADLRKLQARVKDKLLEAVDEFILANPVKPPE